MFENAPFPARRAPLLAEGASYLLEGQRRGRKERLLSSDGLIRWREGAFDAKTDPGLR